MISREALGAVLGIHPLARDARYWAIRWQYGRAYDNGSFVGKLIDAAVHADEDNLSRIGMGWPGLAEAIRKWRGIAGWCDEVEAWAESLAVKEPL